MKAEDPVGHIDFDLPKNRSNVIKVIGVGGGGGNAVNHMFEAGINGVDFVICNTDSQALQNSPVPNKIQLGVSLTEGLGAGANPEVGERAAVESMEEIKALFGPSTKMVFITAGMGGGTGTGAAPIIAKAAREMDILTVGIVTIPFQFEGLMRCQQAQKGIDVLRENVDSLIVVNNNKLREIYGNLGFRAGFAKADEVLAIAARGIAEVITHHYMQNIDLRDAKTVLSNSGTAIMGSAEASGSGRAKEAIVKALDSPLLNDNKITGAKNVLLLIVSGTQEITIDEIGEINDHIQLEAGYGANIIMGIGEDESLGDAVSVTIIATGFNTNQQAGIVNSEAKKIVHRLETDGESTGTAAAALKAEAGGNGSPAESDQGTGQQREQESDPYTLADQRMKSQSNMAGATPETQEEEQVEAPAERIVYPLDEVEPEDEEPYIEVEGWEVPSEEEIRETVSDMNRYSEDLQPVALSILRELPVVYEVVEERVRPEAVDDDFVIIESTDLLKNIEVHGVEFVSPEESRQATLPFDLPLSRTPVEEDEEERTVIFDLSENLKNMPVNYEELEAQEPRLIQREVEAEAYLHEEARLMAAKAEDKAAAPGKQTNPIVGKTTTQVVSEIRSTPRDSAQGDEDPFFRSISDTEKTISTKAARTLKDYNYRFKNNRTSIEDIENEPAYKRMGIELDKPSKEPNISRTSLGEDSNNEVQLRSNNSFLHDNVD